MILNYMEKLRYGNMPIRKKIVKKGTIQIGVVEATPVVWKDRLIRFEWVRSNLWGSGHDDRKEGYYHFKDMESDEEIGVPFAHEHAFGCCYEENGIMYVHGVRGNGGGTNSIDVFWSEDLVNWKSKEALTVSSELCIYNTSVCKSDNGQYIMTVEVGGPEEMIGKNYTILFAKSSDVLNWELLPIDKYMYTKERYSACPVIRYVDGMYYMVYLEMLAYYRCVPYIIRSSDLIDWEIGQYNPFLWFDDNDKKLLSPERFSDEEKLKIENAVNNNNSDVDFCEFQGKTYILYSWGNQLGKEFLSLAVYDGSLEEMVKAFFV